MAYLQMDKVFVEIQFKAVVTATEQHGPGPTFHRSISCTAGT